MNNNICTKCGLCVRVCGKAITLGEKGPEIDLSRCNGCGHCASVCPTGAIENPKAPLLREVYIPSYEEATTFLRSSRSVRFFKDETVPRETMTKLIDIGRYPQTGSNSQGISYIVLEGKDKIRKLLELFCSLADKYCPKNPDIGWIDRAVNAFRKTGKDGILRDCPELIFALSEEYDHRGRENAQFSLTFIALTAPTLGLGTCWAGIFERFACHEEYGKPIAEAVGVPEGKRIRGVMMAGIPDIEFRRIVERDPLDLRFV